MTIGKRIRQARKQAGLSQKQLGERLNLSASMIGQWENDLRKPKFETAQRIATALNVDVNWLRNGQTLEQRDQAMKDYVDKRFYRELSFNATPDPEWAELESKIKDGTITDDEALRYKELFLQSLSISKEFVNDTLDLLRGYMDKLNPEGQQKALERIEELTEIPKYQRTENTKEPPIADREK